MSNTLLSFVGEGFDDNNLRLVQNSHTLKKPSNWRASSSSRRVRTLGTQQIESSNHDRSLTFPRPIDLIVKGCRKRQALACNSARSIPRARTHDTLFALSRALILRNLDIIRTFDPNPAGAPPKIDDANEREIDDTPAKSARYSREDAEYRWKRVGYY